MVDQIVQVKGLTKEFPNTVAVDQISFDVSRGEFFGFVGPNGAGKTTTINMICTLIKPTQGTAVVAGFDVKTHPDQVRRSIGLVFQDTTLDERLTAWENLEFHAVIYHIPKSIRKKRIDEVMELVELKNHRDDIINTFSGGMKRRLEVARGLLHSPKVLFLDEPTIGLDPQTRSRIWDYLDRLRQEKDITIFLTTHYLDEAENCDHVSIIDQGKIIALDTPDNLKASTGLDVIHLKTSDNQKIKRELEEKYDLPVSINQGELRFEKENAESFLPIVAADFKTRIKSIGIRRPTLDDVFLNLTGREIREDDLPLRKGMSKIAARAKGKR